MRDDKMHFFKSDHQIIKKIINSYFFALIHLCSLTHMSQGEQVICRLHTFHFSYSSLAIFEAVRCFKYVNL